MRTTGLLPFVLFSLVFLSLFPSSQSYTYSPLSTGTCIPNYHLTWVNGSSNAQVLPTRLVYPACAYNNHLLPTLANAQAGTPMFAYGGYPSYKGPVQSILFTTTNGFQSLLYPPINQSASVLTNWGGLGAINSNGTFIIYGGRVTTSASSLNGNTHVSFDQGRTWSLSGTTSTASSRYETPMLSIPMTNNLVIVGGYNSGGQETNQVWLSTDGLGAVWTLQSNGDTIPTNALGTAVALCDSSYCSSAYSTPNSTLIYFLEYDDGYYLFSYDLGRTWSVPYDYPFSSAVNDVTHRDWITAAADTDSNIYFAGGYNEPDPRVWVSVTKGQTWAPLIQNTRFAGLSTSLEMMYTLYNCMGLTYNPVTLNKRLVMYAYETLFSDGTQYESVIGELDLPNNQTGWGALPNSTFIATTNTPALPAVTWPACAYNVHSLTSAPFFLTAGGAVSLGVPSTGAAASADGLSFQLQSPLPTALYNAAAVVLMNGNILLIGGQTSLTAYSNTVYLSTNNGATFTANPSPAAFSPRSNFISCVQPGTNNVLVIGGNTTSTADNGVWLNTDGTGAVWQQIGTLPTLALQGACVFLYDSSRYSQVYSSVNSSLLVFTHRLSFYRSSTLGASFNPNPSIIYPGPLGYEFTPFPAQMDNTGTRYSTRVVADYDNFLYAMAGYGIVDHNLWFSGDLGYTWYGLKQTNTAPGLFGQFIQASTSCLGLAYFSSVKTLVLYSGQGVVFDSGANYTSAVITLDAAPTFIPSVSGTATSTAQLAAIYNAAQVTCPANATTPAVQWAGYSSILSTLYFPFCGRDVHHPTAVNPTFYMYGGQNSSNLPRNSFYSITAPLTAVNAASHNDSVIGSLTKGYMAVMPSGTLLIMGGLSTAGVATTNVYVSTNGGASFSLSSTSFPALYNGQLVQVPNTLTLILIGGTTTSPASNTSSVFISTDGLGANWTLLSNANPLPAATGDTAVALYDSSFNNPALFTSPNSTLLFFSSTASPGQSLTSVYASYDLGYSWSVHSVVPFSTDFLVANSGTQAPAAPLGGRPYTQIIVDALNNLYAFGVSNPLNIQSDPSVWFSSNKGQTFSLMQPAASTWTGKSAALEIYSINLGCSGLSMNAQGQVQLAFFGGSVWISDGTQVTAAVANILNVANTTYGTPLPPTVILASPQPVGVIPNGNGTACAYNVHARNGVMLALGGSSGLYFTSSSNSFVSSASITSYPLPIPAAPITGAGLALLRSGTLAYYGGLTSTGMYTNAVYTTSSTAGINFIPGPNAAWSPRANFITCTQPLTNTVVVIGGQNGTGLLADAWVTTDAAFSQWSALPNPLPWNSTGLQAGACVFLYDSALIPGSGSTQAASTLLVFTQFNTYFRSTTVGQTWVQQPNPYTPLAPTYQTAPWSTQADASGQRLAIRVVADFDNQVWATGGAGITDNSIWWSGDLAMTWYRVAQINTVSTGFLVQASSSCLGLNYRSLLNGNFGKQFVLYGGAISFTDGTQLSALSLNVNATAGRLLNATTTVFNASSPTGTPLSGYLCFIEYSLPGNVDYPWSVATSVQFTYYPTTVTTSSGTAVQIIAGSGTRTYTNRFALSFSTPLTVAPAGTGGSNNYLYLGNAYPVDGFGITWTLGSPIQLPGHGPSVLFSTINVSNQSGIISESNVLRIDGLGEAYLSTVPGFLNVTIGASNINSLAPNYPACQAVISFTNGLRTPIQPSASNGAKLFGYNYTISDGVSYTVSGNLTFSATSSFANLFDQLGNGYQVITNVTGTRIYTYIPNGQQVISKVSGLSLAAYAFADQRFYPYSLLGAAPGVYSINTAPFFDYNGVEFSLSPSAPVNGLPPLTGVQYNATTLFFTTPEPTAVLTEGYYINQPLIQYQQQSYTLM